MPMNMQKNPTAVMAFPMHRKFVRIQLIVTGKPEIALYAMEKAYAIVNILCDRFTKILLVRKVLYFLGYQRSVFDDLRDEQTNM